MKTKQRANNGEFEEVALLESVTGFAEQLKRGKMHTLRTTTIILPKPLLPRSASEVRAVREKLGASQALFAALLNLPTRTVSSWENNQRKPSGAALKLLEIAEAHPEFFVGADRELPRSGPNAKPRAVRR